MARALYRKYRSKKLDEVVAQEHITTTLSSALKKGQISHAYLLTGPKGVGKTSIARILAHEVNNLPYTDESDHLDIIEIDAASNRSIEDIRNLREKVYLAPTSAKYKVYIIDEVHMLSKDAFNALLKTLEEPPAHVIFILATTELHKVPATIISRTQRYGLRPIPVPAIVGHLRTIADKESLDISDEALESIAVHAGGSFRDALGLLDQASGYGRRIEKADITELLGHAAETQVSSVLEAVVNGDTAAALNAVSNTLDAGTSPEMLASQLITECRNRLFEGESGLASLIQALLRPSPTNPRIALELAIYEAAKKNSNDNEPKPATAPKKVTKPAAEPKIEPEEPKEPAPEPEPKPETDSTEGGDFSLEIWQQVLETIKGQHNTLYGILRMAETSSDGSTLSLSFQFPFHMKRAAEPRHKTVIEDTIESVTGKKYELNFTKKSDEPKKAAKMKKSVKMTKNTEAGAVETVRNIFGGAEPL